ncbi:hypothetical protein [Plantactinospora sp. WMMB782]|uniref:hypothetical protein n=1 Tax=Plantactinospora sp. WMMB782 TaxID=3404121 RepID=UPI003B929C52
MSEQTPTTDAPYEEPVLSEEAYGDIEVIPMPGEARQAAWRAYHAAEPPARGRITTAIETAYAAGLAAGRTAAAADIRAVDASVLNGYCADVAARVAESGANHAQ